MGKRARTGRMRKLFIFIHSKLVNERLNDVRIADSFSGPT